MKIHKSLGLIFLAGCCWNNGWTAPLPPASSQSNDTELTLKTSKRTLGKEYPVPPTITVKGSDFTAELNGKKTHFVRPLVAAAPRLKPSAGGKVIYVSPNGTGNGGKNSPMGSIQEAVDQAGPGDMVVINQGEYVEAVKITKSGREGAPIVITAAPGALPRIILPFGKKSHEASFSLGVVSLHGCGYVWIQGLVLEGDLHRSDSPETWGEKYGAWGIVLSNGAGEGARDLPRRSRRDAAGDAGQAAARARGPHLLPRRRHAADPRGRARHRGDQQVAQGARRPRHLPRRPVLPAQRAVDLSAAAARATQRHPAARPHVHRRVREDARPPVQGDRAGRAADARGRGLARQRPPAAQLDRVDGRPRAGRGNPGERHPG